MTPQESLKYFYFECSDRGEGRFVVKSRCLKCEVEIENDLYECNLRLVLERHLTECRGKSETLTASPRKQLGLRQA